MSQDPEIEYENNCEFNESLDDEVGDIQIYEEKFSPSYILYELKRETYRIALAEYFERKLTELQQLAFYDFPTIIAYSYRQSEHGPGANNPVTKLSHLKDAWEGAINILNALVFGEVRAKGINLKAAKVFHSGNPDLSFKSKIIKTDELKQRLENIRAIIKFSKSNSIPLKSQEISFELLDYLHELQDCRNKLFHSCTPTKEQAEDELKLVNPLFLNALQELRFLENVNIVRFDSYKTKCRFQKFKGYSFNKEYEEIEVEPSKLSYVMQEAGQVVFAFWKDEIFSLSPYLHFQDDSSGHESYLCFYTQYKQSKFWFESIKTRSKLPFDRLQSRFNNEEDEIVKLVVP